jgi:cleavage and polyadenylation specificity factor subunit 3
MDVSEDENDQNALQQERERQQQAELARLHKLGIPVPGVRIRVDKMEASVWLEELEVECGNKVFADRVRAVVERAVEVTAPLWG